MSLFPELTPKQFCVWYQLPYNKQRGMISLWAVDEAEAREKFFSSSNHCTILEITEVEA